MINQENKINKETLKLIDKTKFKSLKIMSDLVLNLKDMDLKTEWFNKFYEEFKINLLDLFSDKVIVNYEIDKKYFYISGFIEISTNKKNRVYYFYISSIKDYEFEEIIFKPVQYIGDYYLQSKEYKLNWEDVRGFLK